MQEPVKGIQPIAMTENEKREALRNHVIGMVNSMNRSQRRAFLAVASKTKSLEKATAAAISRGWIPGQGIKKDPSSGPKTRQGAGSKPL